MSHPVSSVTIDKEGIFNFPGRNPEQKDLWIKALRDNVEVDHFQVPDPIPENPEEATSRFASTNQRFLIASWLA